MLTRRMAKRQHYPLMPMAKIYEHHVNGVQINCEIIEYEKCTGEVCPYEETCRICSTCRTCPDRYGYCGG